LNGSQGKQNETITRGKTLLVERDIDSKKITQRGGRLLRLLRHSKKRWLQNLGVTRTESAEPYEKENQTLFSRV